MYKNGLSSIMATVLMILLVILAVSAMWAFVRPAIDNSASQINTDCFTLNLQMLDCRQHSSGVNPTYDVDLKINRKSGSADLKELRYAFITSTQESLVAAPDTNVPDELETVTPTVDLSQQIVSAIVTGVLGDNKVVCNPNSPPVICVQV